MSVGTIFLTPEEVMDRWGMIDPYDFITKIGFKFSPTGDPRIDRHRFKTGDLLAYERSSKELAVWGESEGGEDRDFSKFVDCEDGLQPHCLEYLTFSFDDVEECERQNPSISRYAERARPYRQEKGQNVKQLLEEIYRENKENLASVTGEIDEDETAQPDENIDKSDRVLLKRDQVARARCRVIAELILEQLPDLRMAQLIQSPYITNLACNIDVESEKTNQPMKEKRRFKPQGLRNFVKHLFKPAIGNLPSEVRNQEIEITIKLIDK